MRKQSLGDSLCTLCTYICTCYIKQLTIKTRFFIHADIVALVSEFVVVAILSEWWLVPTTVCQLLWAHPWLYSRKVLQEKTLATLPWYDFVSANRFVLDGSIWQILVTENAAHSIFLLIWIHGMSFYSFTISGRTTELKSVNWLLFCLMLIEITMLSGVNWIYFHRRGKIRWAKHSRFQPYEVLRRNTFAVHWPLVFITYV